MEGEENLVLGTINLSKRVQLNLFRSIKPWKPGSPQMGRFRGPSRVITCLFKNRTNIIKNVWRMCWSLLKALRWWILHSLPRKLIPEFLNSLHIRKYTLTCCNNPTFHPICSSTTPVFQQPFPYLKIFITLSPMFPLLEWESIFKQISVHSSLIGNAFWILGTLSCYFTSSPSACSSPAELSPAVRTEELFMFHKWICSLLLCHSILKILFVYSNVVCLPLA